MACFHPLKGWASKSNPSGITFNKKLGYEDLPRTVPCGNCSGCRLERSRQWAVRCYHESQMHEHNSFVTLTYSPENLPENGSISVRTLQLFVKRLRKKYPHKIRFFACGEYGDLLERPHYHLCLFGHDFMDRKYYKTTETGDRLYRSAELESLWSFGFSTTGDVTFKSAAYVARYVMKKINGTAAALHYGEKTPEFLTMSRRPGVGTGWLKKFESDVYPNDFVVINEKKRDRRASTTTTSNQNPWKNSNVIVRKDCVNMLTIIHPNG